MRRAIEAKQKLLRAWGIRYKEAIRKRTVQEVMSEIETAVEKGQQALSSLTTALAKPDPDTSNRAVELLNDGLMIGLQLGCDTCRAVHRHLQQIEAAGLMLTPEDVKVLNLGSQTAGWLVRAGVRIADLQVRQDKNRMNEIWARIAEARLAGKTEAAE